MTVVRELDGDRINANVKRVLEGNTVRDQEEGDREERRKMTTVTLRSLTPSFLFREISIEFARLRQGYRPLTLWGNI